MRTIQPSFAAGELSPSMAARTDVNKYHTGARTMKNFLVHQHGGASNRQGTEFVGQSLGNGRLIPFQFSVTQNYVLEFTDLKMRIIKDDGYVASGGSIVEITSPFALADLAELRYTQSADTIYFAHPSYAPRSLTRGNDHHLWTFTQQTFVPGVDAPTTGLTATASGAWGPGSIVVGPPATGMEFKYVVSTVKGGEESLPSAEFSETVSQNYWIQGGKIDLSWDAVTDADSYRVYKNYSGFWGFIGESETTDFVDDNISPDISDGYQTSVNPFGADRSDDCPGVVGIFEQRIFYGRTNNQPQTIWGSQTGLFNNFGKSSPLKDTDAMEVTIASNQVNAIEHLVPMSEMIVMTSGGEWLMTSGQNSDALTPTSVQFKLQGYRGTDDVRPQVVGNSILFVQRSGRVVRDLAYTLEADGYQGNNVSVLANHLFRDNKITDWSYQQDPESILWAVRDDGDLLGFTYLKEHEIWAWHHHETQGEFVSVCSIPNGDYDEVYFMVKRNINSSDVYYVEKFVERLPDEDIEKAVFMDCADVDASVSGTTVSGLAHLEGEEVIVLADGNVITGLTVDGSGEIELPQAHTTVHVGLSYTSDLETLDVDFKQNTAQVQGARKKIHKVILRLEKTREIFVGPDSSSLTEMKIRSFEDYNEATELFTGDKEIVLAPKWARTGRVFVRITNPLPATILAIIPEVTIGS